MLKDYKFKVDDEVVIISTAKDLLKLRGEKAIVTYMLPQDHLNDYIIETENVGILRVKEKEIAPIEHKALLNIKIRDKVLYTPTNEEAVVYKIDYYIGHIGLEFENGSTSVSRLEVIKILDNEGDVMQQNYFEEKGLEIGKLVNKKQAAYGDSIGKTSKLMRVFLEGYKNEDNTYTIPEELLDHILLQVRIIDKQNRIFSNPKGDLMQENPYADTVGYSLLGMRMAEQK